MSGEPKGPTGTHGPGFARDPLEMISGQRAGASGPQGVAPVSRDEFGMPPKTASAAESEKKIGEFFSAANKTRHGLEIECPFCQAAMVVRLRGRDGRAFLGCTRYPQCSGSFDIPDKAQHEAKNWERQLMTPVSVKAMLPDRKEPGKFDEDTGELVAPALLEDLVDEALERGMPPGRLTEISGKSLAWKDETFHTFKAVKDISCSDRRVKIRRGDEFYFDGRSLLYRGEERLLPEMKALLGTDWVRYIGVSEVREIAVYRAKVKREKDKMKEATDQADTEAPDNGITARLARSAKKAPYRMARMRALTTGKKAILAALKTRVKPAAFDMIEAFLDTDAGQGAVIGIIGLTGPMTPKLGKNKHVQAVCEEFLDEGVAKGFNQILSLVAMIVEPALESAIAEIPGVDAIADKVVPKRRRKRVASETRVSREPREPQAEEDEDAEERTPLRAVASR